MRRARAASRAALAACLGVIPCLASPADAAHPRLILTPPRVAELRASRSTTRAALWKQALDSANQFRQTAIPQMQRADNRFRYIGDTMPVLGLAYWMTGDRAYAESGRAWLRAILAVKEWSGSQNLGRSSWVLGSALLYDWLYDELGPADRAAVRARLEAEGEILMREHSYWRLLSNHCLIETSALGAAGLALGPGSEPGTRFVKRARERTELIIEHAPLDGAWSEGVQYWEYGTSYFLRFLEALKTTGTADYYPRYNWFKQTTYFPIYFSLPGQRKGFINFSDCCESRPESRWQAAFLPYLAASAYRNGQFQDYANQVAASQPYKFSWMDFIAYDPTVPPVDFHQLAPGKHFDDSGFVVMRSGWDENATVVGFRCGPAPGHRNQNDPRRLERRGFGPGHQHPDINSFSIFSHGKWLAIDPGYVHMKTTGEHNTVLVNGHGQAGAGSEWLDYMAFENRLPAPAILHAESTPEYDYAIGDAGNIYIDEAGLAGFRRHLLYLKPGVVVVADDLAAKAPARFEWLLQALDSINRTGAGTFEIREGGVRLSVNPVLPAKYEPDHRLAGIPRLEPQRQARHLEPARGRGFAHPLPGGDGGAGRRVRPGSAGSIRERPAVHPPWRPFLERARSRARHNGKRRPHFSGGAVARPSFQKRAAHDHAGHAEVDHQARDVHQGRDKRRRSAGRVQAQPPQQEREHGTRHCPEQNDPHQAETHRQRHRRIVRAVPAPDGLPEQDARHSNNRQHAAEHEAGGELAANHPPQVPQPKLPKSHGAHHQCGGL